MDFVMAGVSSIVGGMSRHTVLDAIVQFDSNFVKRWLVRDNLLTYFFHLLPKLLTYSYVELLDGMARIYPTCNATTGNRSHVSSAAPLLGVLNPGRFID